MRATPTRFALALVAGILAAGAARAGNTTATLEKQTLVVRGDDLGAYLVISRPAPSARGPALDSTVVVSPLGKDTVNGASQPAVFSPVLHLRIELGDGPDSVQIIELALAGDLAFEGGEGNNQLYLDGATFGGKCTFLTGGGPDLLNFAAASGCGGDVKILLGEGINEVRLLAGSSFGDDLSLKLGAGSDEVTLGAAVAGSAKLFLGEGDNTLNAPGSVGDDLSCKAGAGVDTLGFSGFEAGGRVVLKPGSGNNVASLGPQTLVGKSFKWKSGAGNDTVAAVAVEVGEDLVLVLSAGNNVASLADSVIADDFVVKAKSGTDTLNATLNVIGGETIVKGVP